MPWLTKTRSWLVIIVLGVLIALAVGGLLLTRDSGSTAVTVGHRRAPLVDEQPVQTARRMALLASTREEQRFAQQAFRLADHAVDLAFADAIREASMRPAASNPETAELFAHVSRAEAQVKSDQELVDAIKTESKGAHTSDQEIQQQLDLVQAQLELDKDELDSAKTDLLRSGADPLSRIQRQFARYQAAQTQGESDPAHAATSPAVTPPNPPANDLWGQFKAWRTERERLLQLQQAHDETLQKHDQLQREHDSSDETATSSTPAQPQANASADASGDRSVVVALQHLAEKHKILADLGRRVQDHQDLADVYANWAALVQSYRQAALHSIIRSLLLILLIILGIYLADRAIDRSLAGLIRDQRRLRTLRVIVRFVFQVVGVLLILFVAFGMPNQTPTILGLAGAGLTVAMKDFIVAFFGWFALMGRNGIRVGDWVEIQGVVGEVAEIGLLRTVLLETGNWNDAGHPTGRKVAFVNSFAIEGHYFNFSTSGQWLWDELQILVPPADNPYPIIEAIQKLVTAATEPNARMAEEEWQRATHRERMASVSAAPAINLRPTTLGVEVHVRYITRANERYATRARLYEEIVGLLHQRPAEPAKTG
jgi:small-conductance mechanosensitive channel